METSSSKETQVSGRSRWQGQGIVAALNAEELMCMCVLAVHASVHVLYAHGPDHSWRDTEEPRNEWPCILS